METAVDPFVGGSYAYLEQLTVLEDCRPMVKSWTLPEKWCRIVTPLKSEEWEWELRDLPDRRCADYLVRGISEGFRLGYEYSNHECRSASRNMLSAERNPRVIDEYLGKEIAAERVVGPVNPKNCPVQISRFGVIPKAHQKGKWRLILDLSHPENYSVNDGIDPELCSLSYTSVDHAAKMIVAQGKGALLAKLDLESAYRMIPVHPVDRPLLGMRWGGKVWLDTTLPFGLRSAPKIFNVMADCLQWIFRNRGADGVIHYLDDYLFVGPPASGACGRALRRAIEICHQLGVRLSLKKLEGPSVELSFLGLQLDTDRMEIRLPEDKLSRLRQSLEEWKQKRSCTKRELLSLLGVLHHACKVVRPGRSFLRRMIELSKVVKLLHHHIRLNVEFRSDLEWWVLFLHRWNGVGMLPSLCSRPHSRTITSDASGKWGCGAFYTRQWFQFPWPAAWAEVHITVKELLPIVMSCAMWGHQWKGETVMAYTDNAAVVSIVNSGKSTDKVAMHLVRCLFFIAARGEFTIKAAHVAGKLNVAADALSRNRLSAFRLQVPTACRRPTPIPPGLVKMLVTEKPDWTSARWRRLFNAIFQKAWQVPHNGPTGAASRGT